MPSVEKAAMTGAIQSYYSLVRAVGVTVALAKASVQCGQSSPLEPSCRPRHRNGHGYRMRDGRSAGRVVRLRESGTNRLYGPRSDNIGCPSKGRSPVIPLVQRAPAPTLGRAAFDRGRVDAEAPRTGG